MQTNCSPSSGSTRIYFGGSRSFENRAAVSEVVTAILRSGSSVAVGCAIGADALVIGNVVGSGQAAQLRISAAFGPGGAGSWSGSAVRVVGAARMAGALVLWWAGGEAAVPLRGRLLRRSLDALYGCSAAVFFLSSPSSPGSLRVASFAAGSGGLPVFAFCATEPDPLASLVGAWVPGSYPCLASAGGLPCWEWRPAAQQPALF